jgi:dTDP-4-dehydrorhamnose 3,5-epimerase
LLNQKSPYGIYNCSNSGKIVSWFEIAQEIFKLKGFDLKKCLPISTNDYANNLLKLGQKISKRPTHSAFILAKLEHTDFKIPTWEEQLKDYLREAH